MSRPHIKIAVILLRRAVSAGANPAEGWIWSGSGFRKQRPVRFVAVRIDDLRALVNGRRDGA